MGSKYQLLPLSDKEGYATSIDPAAALGDGDHFNVVLRETIKTYKSKWLWLLHTILLSSSLTLFTLSVMVHSSTLKYVQEFSAWCTLKIHLQDLFE